MSGVNRWGLRTVPVASSRAYRGTRNLHRSKSDGTQQPLLSHGPKSLHSAIPGLLHTRLPPLPRQLRCLLLGSLTGNESAATESCPPADLRSGLQKSARGRTGLDDYLALLAGLGGVSAPRFSEDGCVHKLQVRSGTATGLTVQQGPDPSHETVACDPPQIPCAARSLVVSSSIGLGRAVG